MVTEVAKDFVWSKRYECMKCQPLIFGKQLYRIERLIDKVDFVITDSPILLSAVYGQIMGYQDSFRRSVIDIFNNFENENIYIERVKPYSGIGRRQSEESARGVDEKVLNFLLDNCIKFTKIKGNADGVLQIVDKLEIE